jgi:hypothetical protein
LFKQNNEAKRRPRPSQWQGEGHEL